jgi:hypothetical protein
MILKIHWDNVAPSVAPDWFSPGDHVVAIWPSPVDHDACFRYAGFEDFDDSDDRWAADFEAVCERLLGVLENTLGTPIIRSENDFAEPRDPTFLQRLLGRTINDNLHDFLADFRLCRRRYITEPRDPTFLQRMLAPTENDNFHDFVADFGLCRLRTGMGHPLIWLSWPKTIEFSVADILNAIAKSIPTTERHLDWTHMVPSHLT